MFEIDIIRIFNIFVLDAPTSTKIKNGTIRQHIISTKFYAKIKLKKRLRDEFFMQNFGK